MRPTAEPQIVLLFGRPGVGKLTVGSALSDATGFPLLHNHAVVDLVESLFPFGSPPFIAMRERLWLEAIDAVLADGLAGLILTFAPERTVTDEFLPALLTHTSDGGGSLRLVELRCTEAALERRLTDPSRQRFGKMRDVAQYHRLEAAGVFARPVMPAAELTLDTDELEPEEAARRIATYLRTAPKLYSRK
jgi:chloramphenicol 3-O-phosphotransferase